jgi:death on curing protein
MLVLNGFEIVASTDEQERVVLDLAASRLGREGFTEWLLAHLVARTPA